ncbi:MAG: tetratricopeptide repeat protein [Bacteroidales bacterium]|nr:tetratricopeptide repeat protein [Bacteroidales bacterium]
MEKRKAKSEKRKAKSEKRKAKSEKLTAHWKPILITFFMLFTVAFSLAQDPQQLVADGNKAYSEGLYTDAVSLYNQVVEAGYEAPELYYNLGNAYFKLNDLPHAILWYERAHRLDPGNENIRFNLNVANNKIADKIDPLPLLFYIRWYQSVVALFPVNTWAAQTILFFILTLACITLYFGSRRLILRKTGFWAGILFLLLTLFTLLFSVSGYQKMTGIHEAIVFDPTITVKSSPDEKSIDLFVLHEGTKVQLIDKIGTWYEVRIANGSVGWLPEEALEEI